jgi:hypothetical protein
MPIRESHFWRRVKKDLAKLPSTKIVRVEQDSINGTPDVILCISGHYVEIELKRNHTCEPTPLQRWNLEEANRCEGYAFVGHPSNWEELFDFLLLLAGVEITRLEIPKCLKLPPSKRKIKSS